MITKRSVLFSSFETQLKQLMRKIFTLAIIALISFPAFSQQQIFIQASNIPGESMDASHHGWIDAFAFTNGASNTVSISSPGSAGAGKAATQNFSFTLHLDRSVNLFRKALYEGSHISNIKVEFTTTTGGSKPIVVSTLEMEDVYVCSITEGGEASDNIDQVNISFVPTRFKYTYIGAGKSGSPVIFGWDNPTNRTW